MTKPFMTEPYFIYGHEYVEWADNNWTEYASCTCYMDGRVGKLSFVVNHSLVYKVLFDDIELLRSGDFWIARNFYNGSANKG